MSGVHKLGTHLRRAVVVRETSAGLWRVEGYEVQGARWRFTWLLVLPTSLHNATRQAEALAQAMGLPVARKALGERPSLCGGVLGRAPAISHFGGVQS